MPGTVSTACQTLQKTLREVWASGSTYAEMTDFFGLTRDQIIRLRDRLALPPRLDRSLRKKGKRHADPTPAQIAAQCAAMKAKHLKQRLHEPPRAYRTRLDMIQFRLERTVDIDRDPLEDWIDNAGRAP